MNFEPYGRPDTAKSKCKYLRIEYLDEVLICKKDNCEEAKEYDRNAVCVYKESPEEGI